MRILFTIILLFTFSLTWAQNVKMGEFSDEEINLKEVSYEPDAAAVVLWEEGESQFSSGLLVTNYLFRVKILSEAGKEHGDIRIRYYIGDSKVEYISSVKAQISNFNGDEVETTKLKKENIFDVDLGEGYRETRITFPNVQVGSILEYSYKKADKNLTFLDGWTFQNSIPTLGSHYQIKMNPNLDYQTISQGYNLSTRAEKSEDYGIYKWTLRNLYSLKEEPYMKNYRDYIERIEFQLFRYKESTHVGELWKNVLNTWEKLGDELISSYRQKGYYRSNPIEKELLDADISGETQLEMASKAYYYVRDNFTAEGVDFIYADQQINQLLKTRTGSPQELSLLLMGILKSQGITCDPVLIGSKGNGRTDIVPFPFLNQFDEILLRTELDGEVKFIDLSDKDAPFGYVDLDKQVKAGLYLVQGTSAIVPLEFEGSGNVVYFSQVDFEGSDLVMNNSIRHYQHEGLNWQKTVDYLEKQKDPLDKLFAESANNMNIQDISFENTLQEKDFVTTSFKIVMESAAEEDMIMFNPIKYSSFSKNPFTQEYRIFPVDFEHKFSEMSSVNIKIPEGYELDDFPQDAVLTIEGSPIVFSYSTNFMNGILTVSSKLAIRNPLIGAEQYPDLKYLMESIASKLQEPVILKKIVAP
ncbi:DUF3857 domain-containing protein [Algoriphagus machipongonensis]|uniref:DUF3857 domain-containing protein n=1 Tax=Algoriphagus machipongonensis TaxID=388413 RepID=A3HUV3_9BACT|nr:DUF3857 domain-containing protein [Algoriphagus machipongonensis]EAZ81925.1 hypothetical protein ALPR1_01750 [Algoriphagus machipongonensis]